MIVEYVCATIPRLHVWLIFVAGMAAGISAYRIAQAIKEEFHF